SRTGINSFPNFDNGYYSITSYSVQEPTSAASIKSALNNSPVYASMEVFEDFQLYPGGIYEHATGSFLGYHAVVIVSYNDIEEYWVCKNSWGLGWGEEWDGKGGYFRIAYGKCGIDTRKCGTASVTNENCYAKIIPNLISSLTTAVGYGFVENEGAYVIGNTTLTDNTSIPSNSSLLIKSGSTINLNDHSIIAADPGGIVNNGATINGLRATLTANLDLRGLCGRIQGAADYAGPTNEIWLQNGNFYEDVTIYNVYALRLDGASENYNHFGHLNLINCDHFEGYDFGAERISVSNAGLAWLYRVGAWGTD
ncbi:MAG: C1 family peptidase, partial [Calditrichota bacterium]